MNSFYRDPTMVDFQTKALCAAGFVTFQLYMLDRSEEGHAHKMLALASPPANASVLSLGCGVGGMELYWSRLRPDLKFTLVNNSWEQLQVVVAPGERILMDIEKYEGPQADCVLLAYVLGHVKAREVVDRAKTFVKPGGKLIVWDIFNTNEAFGDFMEYSNLKLDEFTDLERLVVEAVKHPVTELLPTVFFEGAIPALLVYEA